MSQWGGGRRMLLLTEGFLGVLSAKTAVSLVRFCREEVVGIIDSNHAGKDLSEVIGFGEGVPIFATVGEARATGADTLVIGVAPVGGALLGPWRKAVVDSLSAGLNIVAGLHDALADDAELSALAEKSGATISDVRMAPGGLPVSTMRAQDVRAFRVLTVGTDCSSGKMVTSLLLTAAASEAGLDARFVATGQTGIMIAGSGTAVDHVISDFTAGAAEELVVANGDSDIVFIEGQGSLIHPGYSGVTLSLMHGSLPHAMVLGHVAGHTFIHKYPRHVPLLPLGEMVDLYETVMRPVFPSKVVAITVNTMELAEEDARRALDAASDETGLVASDPVRFGVGPVFDAVKELYDENAN